MALTRVLLLRAASIQIARLQNLESTPRHRPQLGRSSCCGPGRSSIRDLPTGTSVCLLGTAWGLRDVSSSGQSKRRRQRHLLASVLAASATGTGSRHSARYKPPSAQLHAVAHSLAPAAQVLGGATAGTCVRDETKPKPKLGEHFTDSTPPPGKKWTPRDLQHHGIWKGHSGM
jgi:hypothetical protein